MVENITFKQWQAVGDSLVLTVALRELHLQYPNMFKTFVHSCYPEVFYNNPFVSKKEEDQLIERPEIDLQYVEYLRNAKYTGQHFTAAFIQEINKQLNLNIQVNSMRPDIFLTEEEKSEKILNRLGIKKPFWIFNAGFKNDMPLKAYPPRSWQYIIDDLALNNIQLIQTGHSHHNHPSFNDVKSVVVMTDNLRDYFSLMYHANGSIGGISLHMHVAAAFCKPCVVIAGSREDVRWELYPDHKFLDSIGYLDCCRTQACWKSKREECTNMGERYPKCFEMIDPYDICEIVLKYEK